MFVRGYVCRTERAKEKKNTYLTYMTGRIQGKVFMLTCGKIVYYHGSSINKKSAVLADLISKLSASVSL